jgi:hypothetical protein
MKSFQKEIKEKKFKTKQKNFNEHFKNGGGLSKCLYVNVNQELLRLYRSNLSRKLLKKSSFNKEIFSKK